MSNLHASESLLGTVIDGKYRVESLIGKGGMGWVFRVTNLQLNNTLALKLIDLTKTDNATSRIYRFKREAALLAKINHPNVVLITDYGIVPKLQLPYLVMEYVEGMTLRRLLQERGTLSEGKAVRIAKQLCAGLHEIHHHGIIHRDLKPENIMIQQLSDGEIVVHILDFGIAKLINPSEEMLAASLTGQKLPGTMRYISPEQFYGLTVDARTDLFSISVTLYEMLTGEVPTVMVGQFRSLCEMRPGATPHLSEIINKGLAYSPDQRPQTVLELKRELESIEEEYLLETLKEKAKTSTKVETKPETSIYRSDKLAPSIPSIPLFRRRYYQILTIMLLLLITATVTSWYFYSQWLVKQGPQTLSTISTSLLPELVTIESTAFLMGSDQDDKFAQPRHQVNLKSFQVSKTLITTEQYADFIKQTNYRPPSHWQGLPTMEMLKQPVTNISWHDAKAYCDWLSQQTRHQYRLPTEQEWEYLAGNKSIQSNVSDILTGYFEWTSTELYLYPGSLMTLPNSFQQARLRILRGKTNETALDPVTFRTWQLADFSDAKLGFRVVCEETSH
ncbi:MAG: bifunctional serine/threonine-protein kinase/formylglycine-generating enzyme family protein [Acidobacteriota bacterium]